MTPAGDSSSAWSGHREQSTTQRAADVRSAVAELRHRVRRVPRAGLPTKISPASGRRHVSGHPRRPADRGCGGLCRARTPSKSPARSTLPPYSASGAVVMPLRTPSCRMPAVRRHRVLWRQRPWGRRAWPCAIQPIDETGWVAGTRRIACRIGSPKPDGGWATLRRRAKTGVLIDGRPAAALPSPADVTAPVVETLPESPSAQPLPESAPPPG